MMHTLWHGVGNIVLGIIGLTGLWRARRPLLMDWRYRLALGVVMLAPVAIVGLGVLDLIETISFH